MPVIVPLTIEPGAPPIGVMPVMTGGTTTVNVAGGDVPPGAVTVTIRGPSTADGSTDIMSGRDVAVPPLWMMAETPVPLKLTAVAPDRTVP
jgi:hypothetical protein